MIKSFFQVNKQPHANLKLRVVSKLIVNCTSSFFSKGCSFSLQQWFHPGQDCRHFRKSMLGHFPVYLESYIENIFPIFDELQKHVHKETCLINRNQEIYALLLPYTCIKSYRMLKGNFPLPSLSLLHKIRSGRIDSVISPQTYKNEGNVFNVWRNVRTIKAILLVI